MSFKVLVATGDPDNPYETIHEIDDKRVTRVGLTSATGEVGAARVEPNQTEVLLTFEFARVDGRPTLADIESQLHPTRTGEEADQKIAEMSELPTVTNTGGSPISGGSSEGATSGAEEESPKEPDVVNEGDTDGDQVPSESDPTFSLSSEEK